MPPQNSPQLPALVRGTDDAAPVLPQTGISPLVLAAMAGQPTGIAVKVNEFLQRKG